MTTNQDPDWTIFDKPVSEPAQKKRIKKMNDAYEKAVEANRQREKEEDDSATREPDPRRP